VDGAGNVVLAATTTSDVGLGGTGSKKYESRVGGRDIVVWKLAPDGTPLWDRIVGGDDDTLATPSDQWISSVAVDPSGTKVTELLRIGRTPFFALTTNGSSERGAGRGCWGGSHVAAHGGS